MEKRKRQRPARPAGGDFTLAEWCQLRRISLAMFYKLDGQGKAPATVRAGRNRTITEEADRAWVAANQTTGNSFAPSALG
jgi:hypothetical protein